MQTCVCTHVCTYIVFIHMYIRVDTYTPIYAYAYTYPYDHACMHMKCMSNCNVDIHRHSILCFLNVLLRPYAEALIPIMSYLTYSLIILNIYTYKRRL